MPYVRSHGNQIAIVHGERDTSTGKVVQRKLFTLYSKIEASAAIGNSNSRDSAYFQQLLEGANPKIKFNWISIKKEIRKKMNSLPDLYPLRQVRSQDTFRKALDEFTRQLVVTDPAGSPSGRATLKDHVDDLEVVIQLIRSQLKQCTWRNKEDEFPIDACDPFCWRYEVHDTEVPNDIEEVASSLYESGRYDEAKRMFALLVRCFPSYAEGYNYLGLIALYQGLPKEAVEHFGMTVKTGRNLFPKRIPKADYWNDLSTRPYIRGLINLALTLVQIERFKEALDICDQLDRECGAKGQSASSAHRASAHLNLHNWQASLDAAMKILSTSPGEGFIAGYALFELGRRQEAVELFLHATLNHPHTAYMLLDCKKPKPVTGSEIQDHNSGLILYRSLPRFFATQSRQSRTFFRKLGRDKIVVDLLESVIRCTRNHSDRTASASIRENFEHLYKLKSRQFAKKKTREILATVGSV